MNDRYLYRAKQTNTGEWTYGYLYGIWERKYILWGMTNDEPNMTEVDPSTICQCTGLKDKSGKLIWENDIIKCKDIITAVRWNTKYASWALTKKGWMYDHFFGESQDPEECEVIGNIFDEGSENIGKGAEEN